MRLRVTDVGVFDLAEPWDFKRLEIRVDPMSPETFRSLAARLGELEDADHLRLAPGVLRFLSPHADDPAWVEGFEAMLAKAAEHGWVDAAGGVRAHIVQEAPPVRVSDEAFRGAMRRLAASVCAITTGDMAAPVGMVASSAVSICAEPPLVGVFVIESSSSLPSLLEEGRFAVNVLARRHAPLIERFTKESQGRARFEGAEWTGGATGLPTLPSALAILECRLVTSIGLGTHSLLVGRVESAATRDDEPMVYFNSGVL